MPFIVTSKLGEAEIEPRAHETAEAAVRDAIHRFGCGQDEVTVVAPDGGAYRYHEFPAMMQKHGAVREAAD
ncbi:MAG TPA: hypothetical protein VM434_20635 [Beijerinckiaceae bacterium]|nr:hypothetical protein [Beijerinckiaceae bacterium]